MSYKLIKKEQGIILVENRLIREGEKYIDYIHQSVSTWEMGFGIHEGKTTWCDVIIGSTFDVGQGFPINNSVEELNELCQLDVEIDVEKIASDICFCGEPMNDHPYRHPAIARKALTIKIK